MAENIVVGNLRTVLGLDSSSFDAGAKKASSSAQALASTLKGSMQGVEQQFKVSERAVANFEKSLRGDRLISTANNITAAVQKIGGATKLTDAEATRLNHTLDKAIQKYRALGVEAPAAMRKLHAETARATTATTTAMAGTSRFAGTVGQLTAGFTLATVILGSTRALVDMGRAAVENAGNLVDMSAKTGLATSTLQRMEAVAKQTGATVDQLSDASFRLGVRVSGGSDRVRQALREIGLSFEEVRRMSPDQLWEAVVRGLGKVTDANERNRLGMELMGRTFASVAPAIAEGYGDIADAASVSSDAQIKAIDAAADAWEKFKGDQQRAAQSMLGNMVLAVKGVKELTAAQLLLMGINAVDVGASATITGLAQIGQRKKVAGDTALALEFTPEQLAEIEAAAMKGGDAIHMLANKYQMSRAALQAFADAHPSAIRQLRDLDKEIKALNASQRAEIEAAQELGGDALKKLEDQYGLTEGALARYFKLQAQNEKATRATTKAVKEQAAALEQIPASVPRAIQDLMGPSAQDFAPSPDAGILRGGLGFAGISVDADAMREAVGTLKIWDDTNSSILASGEDIQALLEQHEDILVDLPSHLDDMVMSTDSWATSLQGAFHTITQGFAAIQGMAAQLNAMATSTSRAANIGTGALAGAQQFSFLGPYGALFGLGAGALAGSMQDPRSNALMALNEFRTNIIRQFQETATMTQQLEAGNDRWRQMTILVRDAYEDLGMTANDAQRDLDRLFDSDDLVEYQRNLERINEAFARQNALTDARIQRQDLLNEAVERWGLSFEEAGEGFQRGSLASQAELLIQDFQLLTESGADMTLVVERMSGAVNEFVKQAVETGTEVPEAMRPLLEAMVDAGLLTDKTGKVVKNLSDAGIRFGAELEGMFERVLEKLDTLIARLMAPFSDVPLGRFGPQTGTTAVVVDGRTGPPVGRGPTVRHLGGMITAHGGAFLGKDEVLVKALTGESVLSRPATQLIGGKRGVDALNMGMSPFAGMGSALSGMGQSFSTSAAELLRGSIRDASGGAGIRMSDGDGELSISIAQMTVVSNDPRKAAETIAKELPNAINTNLHGVRTKLRKQLR